VRTFVIIPALNEGESIGLVVGDLPADLLEEIVVVNNGSTDDTVLRARAAGATVIHEDIPGYGRACLKGIAYVSDKNPDIIVFLDGDYSDYPEEIVHILRPILDDKADFVVGSRILGNREAGAMLPQALFGNRLACAIIWLVYGVRFTDLGPFRAIAYQSLERLKMQDQTYGWTVEMQIKAARLGLRCVEVPVSYRRRVGVSKVTGTVTGTVKASAKILGLLAKSLVADFGRKKGSAEGS
jgi:glycosyltransferase involved in cell wall biosynthesis